MTNLTITPIGTCRIHTPLKRGSLRYPIELDLRRNYGFVHTSAEALQLISFLRGDLHIPGELAPFIVRGSKIQEYGAQTWSLSDLHVVEISSAKKLVYDNLSLQINYVTRYFSDFFANAERSKTYWRLVRRGDRSDLLSFLGSERTFRLLTANEREILLGLRIEQQSFQSIRAEMAQMVDMLGENTVIFVTHVNGRTPDDELIPLRDRLIRWVKLGAEQLGAKAFDPSAIMLEMGQESALENGGLDLTHYTPAFSDRVYDELHQLYLGQLLGAALTEPGESSGDLISKAASHFENMLEVGDFVSTAREVFSALANSPEAVPLIQLRGVIRARIGDYDGAIQDLFVAGDTSSLSQPMRVALLDALARAERFDEAARVASDLIADEYEHHEVYALASAVFEQLNDVPAATSFAKQAFRLNPTNAFMALRALQFLSDSGADEQVRQWRDEIVETLRQSSTESFELCRWAIANKDEELFSAALGGIAGGDKGATLDLVQDALTARMYRAVARSLEILLKLGRLPPPLARSRAQLFEHVLDSATVLYQSGNVEGAHICARAIEALSTQESSQVRIDRLVRKAKRMIRSWVVDVRKAVREAMKGGRPGDAIALYERTGDLATEDAATVVAIARALVQLGRGQEALEFLKSINNDVATNVAYRRWSGRIAKASGDYVTALESYGALRLESELDARIRLEVDRFFLTATNRAIKKIRLLISEDLFDDALRLTDAVLRHTGEIEKVERELARMFRRLRTSLLALEGSEENAEDQEEILRYLIQIRPHDQSMLRRLALELMRQFRFDEAATFWRRICDVDPDNESARRNLHKCKILARRRPRPDVDSMA